MTQRIRTLAEIPFEFPVFTDLCFKYQEISEKALKLHRLGLSHRQIGKAIGVTGKEATKAVIWALQRPRIP